MAACRLVVNKLELDRSRQLRVSMPLPYCAYSRGHELTDFNLDARR